MKEDLTFGVFGVFFRKIRRPVAVPGNLRGSGDPVRDHPDLREAPEQGRDGGERHRPESRTVSVRLSDGVRWGDESGI